MLQYFKKVSESEGVGKGRRERERERDIKETHEGNERVSEE